MAVVSVSALGEGASAGTVEEAARADIVAPQIDPRFEGQGLGSQLVRAAFDEARSDG